MRWIERVPLIGRLFRGRCDEVITVRIDVDASDAEAELSKLEARICAICEMQERFRESAHASGGAS